MNLIDMAERMRKQREDTLALQKLMRGFGIELNDDGYFGPVTADAIEEVQGAFDMILEAQRGNARRTESVTIKAGGEEWEEEAEIDEVRDSRKLEEEVEDIEDIEEIEEAEPAVRGTIMTPNIVKDIPFWCQADERWGARIVGQKRTFKQVGCAMSALAMDASRVLEREVTPIELDEFFDNNDGYQGDSVIWSTYSAFLAANDGGEFSYVRMVGGDYIPNDERFASTLTDRVDNGQTSLMRLDYLDDDDESYDHFVLCVGYEQQDDGNVNFIFHDPGTVGGNAYQEGYPNSIANSTRHGGFQLVGLDYFVS